MIKNRRWTFFPIMVIVILFIGIIIPVHAGTTNNPAISVTVSPSTITKGDTLHITGSSTDTPSSGISIWILCKDYADVVTVQPDSTGMFSYDFEDTTRSRSQCYIVAQHPMQNNQFDIYLKSSTVGAVGYGEVHNRLLDAPVRIDDTHILRVLGMGSLRGSDAGEYLTEALKDPNVDDSYAETQFTVIDPTTTTTTTLPISTSPTSHSFILGTANPTGDLLSGTSTSVSFQIDYDEIFPRTDSLQLITELNNPKWKCTKILNNEPLILRPDVYAHDLTISGWELEYPSDVKVTVKATLTGIAPSDNLPKKIVVLRVQQINSQNEIMSVYDIQTTVKEPESTITTTSPTIKVTTVPTTITTTSPITNVMTTTTTVTPKPTATVNYSATIERLEREIAEQNEKIEEQGSWIDMILRFLGLK
jgi:hypothetical protein